MKGYRILSLDGGGVRGIYTATVLEQLEAAHPGTIGSVNLFAGTSTGSIIAVGLAAGYTPRQLRELYENFADDVFADSRRDNLTDLGFAVGAQYDHAGMRKILTRYFGDMRLRDLDARILVPSFDLSSRTRSGERMWKPKFFHNFDHSEDSNERVIDVVMRSSAAPTYFPVFQGYIDGGVVANNPSMAALAQALDANTGSQFLNELVMLSIGTGRNRKFIEAYNSDWGWSQWAFRRRPNSDPPFELPLLELLMDGSSGVAHYQCTRLLGRRYHRFNPILDEYVALDDIRHIPRLKRWARSADLKKTRKWIGRYFVEDDWMDDEKIGWSR